jgi:4-hydroxy-3-polyprenylbenzoate decarboxylase
VTVPSERRPWVVGVSGASGTPYAAAVLRGLLRAGEYVDLVVSRAARLTILDETGHPFRDGHAEEDLRRWLARGADGTPDAFGVPDEDIARVRHWAAGDLAAGPSSGSYPSKGMLIVPASTAGVAGVALGLSKDLLQRAASVTLKERRPLIVVVRETPLHGQTLRHLVALDEAGAVVLPASPAFYARATSAQGLVDFVAGRALDSAGVAHRLYRRWEGELGSATPSSAVPSAEDSAEGRAAGSAKGPAAGSAEGPAADSAAGFSGPAAGVEGP